MRLWRIVIQDDALWWFGPCHTYKLWPTHEKHERENW
jgi:hypothetical protein